MLTITIPESEFFDPESNKFVKVKQQTLVLEHSLVSLAKWESKWEKPYLASSKTLEEVIDYIRCMTITQNVNPLVYYGMTDKNIEDINNYIEASMTATWFSESKSSRRNSEVVTAEIIYYWMITLGIPFECQKWHLNRLLTLIRVCTIKNSPPKKMNKKEAALERKRLNEQRKRQFNTKG